MEERRTHNKQGWLLSEVSAKELETDKVTESKMLDVVCDKHSCEHLFFEIMLFQFSFKEFI